MSKRAVISSPVQTSSLFPETALDYERVARAIEFIRQRAAEQPSLEEIAGAVGLSPFHVQRIFSRMAGISPKRFLQSVTVETAKRSLRGSADVLTATLDAGLSSPGRLHDLFVALEAMTPGEFKSRGVGLTLRYGFASTPLGMCFAAVTERGICALEFGESEADRTAILARLHAEWPAATHVEDCAKVEKLLRGIFSPTHAVAPLSVLVHGTNFQVQVWRALLEIPKGTTTTYQDLARKIGRPAAHRAVAGAVGANRIGWLIPCHRVLRSDGALGGYRWGESRKVAALLLETPG